LAGLIGRHVSMVTGYSQPGPFWPPRPSGPDPPREARGKWKDGCF
jgi:hypothetical protein